VDSRTLINRLRALADNVDENEEVAGTGAFFGSDGPFLRELADGMEEAIEKMTVEEWTGAEVVEKIAGKISRA
jgi:hypothetical protein